MKNREELEREEKKMRLDLQFSVFVDRLDKSPDVIRIHVRVNSVAEICDPPFTAKFFGHLADLWPKQ